MIPTTASYQPQNYGGGGGGGGGNGSPIHVNQQTSGNLMQMQKISILQRPSASVPFHLQQQQPTQVTGSSQSPQIVYSGHSGGGTHSAKSPRQEKQAQLKTPLALLNEICSKHHILPQTSVKEEGSPHSRTFTVTSSISHQGDSWEGVGIARSLQVAKQEAARNLLINIDAKNERMMTESPRKEVKEESATATVSSSGSTDPSSPAPAPASVPCLVGNPIGDLTEFCMKFKCPVPTYTEDIDAEGFIMNCVVGEYAKGVGKASTKKAAKRLASAEALKSLTESLKSTLGEKLSSDEVDFRGLTKMFQMKLTVGDSNAAGTVAAPLNNVATQNQPKFATLSDKLRYFRNCTGPAVDLLTKTTFKELQKRDPADILTELCEEQKWTTEFADFVPTEEEPKFRTVVSCTVEGESLLLLSGLGNSTGQAKKAAVVELLGLLRHLLGNKS